LPLYRRCRHCFFYSYVYMTIEVAHFTTLFIHIAETGIYACQRPSAYLGGAGMKTQQKLTIMATSPEIHQAAAYAFVVW